jgi:hypothetical protein
MIKLIEILRVNKPILITLDWMPEYGLNNILTVTNIRINGIELEVDITGMDAFYMVKQNLFVISTFEEEDREKVRNILESNKVEFFEANGSFDIDPNYFQISNSR